MIKRFIVFVALALSLPHAEAFTQSGDEKISIFYDSTRHRVINVPTIFSVEKIDVSETRRIEQSIEKRLQFKQRVSSVEEAERKAREILANDKVVKALLKELPQSYSYLEQVNRMGITKVPAVVLSKDGKDYVVYGQTDIRKALQQINAYRVGRGN